MVQRVGNNASKTTYTQSFGNPTNRNKSKFKVQVCSNRSPCAKTAECRDSVEEEKVNTMLILNKLSKIKLKYHKIYKNCYI